MNDVISPAAASNPFATRFVKPGALPFAFDTQESVTSLLRQMATQGWRGAIVGPHGSGKSTLLASLLDALPGQGQTALVYRLHDGERRLTPGPAAESRRVQATLVVVDGYEQLSRWHRWRLGRLCQHRGLGLLVTSHRPTNLPTLFRTGANVELVAGLVQRLIGGPLTPELSAELNRSFGQRRGDVREVLFDLYDFHERLRRQSGAAPS